MRSLTRSPAAAAAVAAQAKPTSSHRPKGQRTSLSGTKGQRAERGQGRLGTRRTPHAAAQEAWGVDTHGRSSPRRPGGRRLQSEPGGEGQSWGDWSSGKAQTRALPGPFLSPLLSLQSDVPDTQRSAKDVPKLLLRLKGPALRGSAQHTGQDCQEPFCTLNRRPFAWNWEVHRNRETQIPPYSPLGHLAPTTTLQRKRVACLPEVLDEEAFLVPPSRHTFYTRHWRATGHYRPESNLSWLTQSVFALSEFIQNIVLQLSITKT